MNAPLAAVLICLATQAAAATPCERAAYRTEPQAPQVVMTSTNITQDVSLLRGAHAEERTPMRAAAGVRYGADARSVYATSLVSAPHDGMHQRAFTRQGTEERGGTDF